jgi:hypothetical protein
MMRVTVEAGHTTRIQTPGGVPSTVPTRSHVTPRGVRWRRIGTKMAIVKATV